MASTKKTDEYPVKMEKGTGKNRQVRNAHSIIAVRQNETEGFTVIKAPKTADDNKGSDTKSDTSSKK